jgi:hypothetical protein
MFTPLTDWHCKLRPNTEGIVVGAVGQARHAQLDSIPNMADFEQEVWTYFGMGVNLQELYLSPDKMTAPAWDVVAKAAKWSRYGPRFGFLRFILLEE